VFDINKEYLPWLCQIDERDADLLQGRKGVNTMESKREYEEPKMEIEFFSFSDVIVTSQTINKQEDEIPDIWEDAP